ncbi:MULTISPECIES: citrate lyase acyl carrier protein [Erysipelothrix]|uniref:Citrate lyase acyl carrier protein n=1 Tax=Erysipelothrix piscisicarius TaxID=2485784 RepID=A0A3Q8S7T1_9FIRM|nr:MULTISPECIES: citrate lyase acyl carrier protein [Erysipelothrix]MDE8314644.1 citrate lyase acyl carrier protein [Erysipelothrix rhusiopathiae]AZK44413.1 citrate lyase acyl carrier protein [Erysipelothrix piscisicarius]MBK2401613.1 citrate lyase acyl carrier protein [Erysipelothrix sp. strain 2 (EsS2-6-Brazil)]MBK2403267.1 citrate lyase acyl carrier protein [Erysipelothrix sp. strain 2 (EsS2-7-Brazil)]MDE8329976.1 citrate lyase acyl carrier protein [Erysipelothrix rhusiopathiae]
MEIKHSAIAGTLESSDVQVMVEPSTDGVSVELNSSVIKQYGAQILETVHEVLDTLEVKDAKIVVQDQGALDCTIKARVQTAVLRASDTVENLPWGSKL